MKTTAGHIRQALKTLKPFGNTVALCPGGYLLAYKECLARYTLVDTPTGSDPDTLVWTKPADLRRAIKGLKAKEPLQIEFGPRQDVVIGNTTLVGAPQPVLTTQVQKELARQTPTQIEVTIQAGAFNKIAYATHREKTRYALHGVALDQTDIVATDGKRLAVHHNALTLSDNQHQDPFLVPREAALSLMILGQEVSGRVDADKFSLTTGSLTVSGQLLPGVFPPWREVTKPAEQANGPTLRINPADLSFPLPKNAVVRLTVKDRHLHVEHRSEDFRWEATIEANTEEVFNWKEVGLNSTFLAETAKTLSLGRKQLVQTNEDKGPILIRDGDVTHVIMPFVLDCGMARK